MFQYQDDDDVDVNEIRDCGWSVDKVRYFFSFIGKSYYIKFDVFKVFLVFQIFF